MCKCTERTAVDQSFLIFEWSTGKKVKMNTMLILFTFSSLVTHTKKNTDHSWKLLTFSAEVLIRKIIID